MIHYDVMTSRFNFTHLVPLHCALLSCYHFWSFFVSQSLLLLHCLILGRLGLVYTKIMHLGVSRVIYAPGVFRLIFGLERDE